MTQRRKLDKNFAKSVNRKSRSRLNFDGRVDLYSARCMYKFHGSSPYKCMRKGPKCENSTKFVRSVNHKSRSAIKIEGGLTFALQDVCMTQVS